MRTLSTKPNFEEPWPFHIKVHGWNPEMWFKPGVIFCIPLKSSTYFTTTSCFTKNLVQQTLLGGSSQVVSGYNNHGWYKSPEYRVIVVTNGVYIPPLTHHLYTHWMILHVSPQATATPWLVHLSSPIWVFLIGPHQEASDVSEPAGLVYLSDFVTDGLLEPTDLKKNN